MKAAKPLAPLPPKPPSTLERVRAWLALPQCTGLEFVRAEQVLRDALAYKYARIPSHVHKRLAWVLRRLGWESCTRRIDGVVIRGWKLVPKPSNGP